MPETDIPDALRLGEASEVGDGNAHDAVDGVDSVELEGVDHEMKPIGRG
jgi:hypothetical protein